jgi:hypothetical protein
MTPQEKCKKLKCELLNLFLGFWFRILEFCALAYQENATPRASQMTKAQSLFQQ